MKRFVALLVALFFVVAPATFGRDSSDSNKGTSSKHKKHTRNTKKKGGTKVVPRDRTGQPVPVTASPRGPTPPQKGGVVPRDRRVPPKAKHH